jgi:hypothetical protein
MREDIKRLLDMAKATEAPKAEAPVEAAKETVPDFRKTIKTKPVKQVRGK